MVVNAGFADDFAEFRRRGEIGPTPALRITPVRPEMGETVEVHGLGVPGGVLRCITTGEAWPAEQGPRQLRALSPLQFVLLDPAGRVLAAQTIQPWFDRPVVGHWDVPAQLPWGQATWQIPAPPASHAAELRIIWREQDRPGWQPLLPGSRLPIPARRCRLILRAELRSRHAAFTPEATTTVERELTVIPPTPELIGMRMVHTIRCHERITLSGQLRHAQAARLFIADQLVAEARAAGDQALRIEHALQAARCGVLPVRLEADDVEGRCHQLLAQDLRILPRPVQVRTTPLQAWTDAVHVAVDGGTLVAIQVPQDGWRQPMACKEATLALQRHSATLVQLEVCNDAGDIVVHRLTLQPQPFDWSALPGFTALHSPYGR